MNIRGALPALVATIGIAAFAAGCSSDSKGAATTAATTTVAAPAATTAATAATSGDTTAGSTALSGAATGGSAVAIAGFKFGPPEIDVKVGDTVTWTNNDKQAHTATSSGAFDAGSIAPGGTGTATFSTAGTFEYICSFHPFMKGTVVVS
ncbi:MAG: hypothetical protein JWN62_3378 [Acidimicrobiales bacterium]|nr:hypothetical protein [Acidimicrobiales bacterium]